MKKYVIAVALFTFVGTGIAIGTSYVNEKMAVEMSDKDKDKSKKKKRSKHKCSKEDCKKDCKKKCTKKDSKTCHGGAKKAA